MRSRRRCSVLSMMLARTRSRPSAGKRTRRTSHGIGRPLACLWIHSKIGVRPASAWAIQPRAASFDSLPSGCVSGLTSAGPSFSNCSLESPNRRNAFPLQLWNRSASASNTNIASGACSTSVRNRCSLAASSAVSSRTRASSAAFCCRRSVTPLRLVLAVCTQGIGPARPAGRTGHWERLNCPFPVSDTPPRQRITAPPNSVAACVKPRPLAFHVSGQRAGTALQANEL